MHEISVIRIFGCNIIIFWVYFRDYILDGSKIQYYFTALDCNEIVVWAKKFSTSWKYFAIFHDSQNQLITLQTKISAPAIGMLLLLLFVVHNVRTPQSPLTQNTEVYNMTIEEASRFCFCIIQYSGGTRPRAIDSKTIILNHNIH